MRKQWFMISIGYDIGDAESGPMIRTEYEAVKARSLEKAEERASAFVAKNYSEGYAGHSVYPAEEQDMDMIHEMMRWSVPDYETECLPF